ncbi:MAG: c-type cytochrome [Gammaproteobacteria bacterium]|nr:c-type cytochrome [Gammaproteobacteria bacterium]
MRIYPGIRKSVVYYSLILLLIFPALLSATEQGESLYGKFCSQCHGSQGNGKGRGASGLTPKPTDFTQKGLADRLSRKQFFQAVKEGKAKTAMVGYARRLNDEQISAITDYVMASFMKVAQTKKSPVVSGNDQTAGQEIYVQHCAACHGDNGQTAVWARNSLTPPPRNFTTPQAKEELSELRMITSVTHGRPGTAMMSFRDRLSDTQIKQVVTYIRSSFMQGEAVSDPHKATAPHPHQVSPPVVQAADMRLALPGNLKGDVQKGGVFYMNNCFTCHGEEGKGNGPRAHFNRPRPRDFTSKASQTELNRPRIFSSIRDGKRGTVMPAWGKVLNEQEIANVAEFVFQAYVKGNGKLVKQAREKKSL